MSESQKKWQAFEKVGLAVFTGALLASLAGLFGMYTQVAVLQSQVDRHEIMLTDKGHESAVLDKLDEIKTAQTAQAVTLADIAARVRFLEKEEENAD